MRAFGTDEAEHLMRTMFAPWVGELNLKAVAFDEGGGTFLLPANPRIVHGGGVICGQATVSAADTVAVMALSALNGRFRMCTTVDLTTHFVRPLKPGDVDIRVDIISNGKRMAYVRIEMRASGDNRIAVTASGAFAYMED
ncbi:PaaI family thioesterase [Aliihoeflea sp. 40Bstr573]|uniref:PaaI family thioesterase n=1 Tax=Aliihoeflea sp. 40Bstr573 TaxID=2696467 RepID=UPI0020946C7C|nr:PaaI family thioesterase [Aliihoeflea sp. 40Bstr573]